MREIKFRAWDDRLGKMLYLDGILAGMFPNTHTIYWDNGCFDKAFSGDIEQYTGLRDKNGREIYEGDILEEEPGYFFEVVYEQEWARFKLQWKTKAIQFPEWNRGREMAVIGNIHENPELIK